LLQRLGVKSRIQNFDEADGKIGTDSTTEIRRPEECSPPGSSSTPQCLLNWKPLSSPATPLSPPRDMGFSAMGLALISTFFDLGYRKTCFGIALSFL